MLTDILVDTGPLVALFDKDDHYHSHITAFTRGKGFRFHTTLAVLTELLHLVDFHVQVQLNVLRWVAGGGVVLHDIGTEELHRICELSEQYSDLPMDFADATLVVVAEKTGIRSIISIDSDFDLYRLPEKEYIHNIFRAPQRPTSHPSYQSPPKHRS